MLTGLSCRKTFWSLSMVTMRCSSVIWLTVRVCGTATSMPDCRTGAVTMKMRSRTRTTSTSGVMLMSESADCVRPLLRRRPSSRRPPAGFFVSRRLRLRDGGVLDGVEELAAEVVHAGGELLQALVSWL